jgi:GntR family transcriptional regulator, rspAB operon transcriptional repressor
VDVIERPKSLTSIAIDRLRDAIIDGSIQLGALLSEKRMAELLGTSKTPVREAFAHLQSLGLIEVLPQKGGIVFRPSIEQVRELCEARMELEVIALRHSMERNRAAFSEHLSEIVRKMIGVYDIADPLAYQRLDNELHYSFFEHCGNSLLARAYDLFNPRICALRTHLSSPQPQLLSRSFEEHKMMAKLVKKGELQRVILLLKEHINRTRECHSKILNDLRPASGQE